MNKLPRPRTAALLFLACLCSALHAAPPPLVVEGSVTLPKFEVKGNAICCYGFGIIATWDAKTQTVTHLYAKSAPTRRQTGSVSNVAMKSSPATAGRSPT